MGTTPLSSRELVERLWRDVRMREEVEARTTVPELPVHEQLTHSDALRYLNQHWDVRPPTAGPSAGRLRSAKSRLKRKIAEIVVGMFTEYFEDEREFRAHVVRVTNSLATGHDRLASEIRQVAEAVRTESRRVTDEALLVHRLLEERVAALESSGEPGAS